MIILVKGLLSVGFIIACVFWISCAALLLLYTFKAVAQDRQHLILYFIGPCILFLGFAQFWLLTQVFPLFLILVLLGLSFLAAVISYLIGAATGLTIREKVTKVRTLGFLFGFQRVHQNPILGKLQQGIGYIVILGWVASLIIFWVYPIGHPQAVILIALFQFTLPMVVGLVTSVMGTWPIVTSEFLDNDLRNSHLIQGFSSIVSTTVYLLFPIWLFEREIQEVLNITLPSFSILLSIPLALFLLLYILPYYLGLYKFKHQAQGMLDWRRNWIRDVKTIVALPEGPARSEPLNEKLGGLREEIEKRFAQNNMFHMYQDIMTPDIADRPLSPARYSSPVPAPALASGQDAPLQAAREEDPTLDIHDSVQVVMDALKGRSFPLETDGSWEHQVYDTLRNNQANLIDWDIRFAHLYQLLQLYRTVHNAHHHDISGFIDAYMEQLQERTVPLQRKANAVAGVIMSIITTTLLGAFQAYQDDIISIIDRLTRST